jgi:hypothetical protein
MVSENVKMKWWAGETGLVVLNAGWDCADGVIALDV